MRLEICETRQRILDALGHVLVTGGPGCGKTTIALLKAHRRIDAGLSAGQSVLFLSFSRAAVARIVDASQTTLPRDVRKWLQIQTFHSLFWEIVRSNGYLLGAPRQLKVLLPFNEKALRGGDLNESLEWTAQREELFRNEGLVAFDLFATKALAVLQASAVIQEIVAERFPLIIVDEAQDTADPQWECLKLLSRTSQVICLADLDQQIYDYRPEVSSDRVMHISVFLKPLVVDLGTQNNRSPDNDIVAFGNDILMSRPRGSSYKGVSRNNLPPRAEARDKWIRQSIGIISSKVKKATGRDPQSIALLAAWGKGVALISNALRGSTPNSAIRHEVLFDEGEVFLAAQVLAYCLEPRSLNRQEDVGRFLDLIVPIFRSRNSPTHKKTAEQITKWASDVRQGKIPRGDVARKAIDLFQRLRSRQLTGDPPKDWRHVEELLIDSGSAVLTSLCDNTPHMMSFDRGRRISAALAELWQSTGTYAGAGQAIQSVLTHEQLLAGTHAHTGISVMTIHKSKGKEFDGVIILDESRLSPLASTKEMPPYPRSRRLFRVGITRARHHTLLLTDVSSPCPLLAGHSL